MKPPALIKPPWNPCYRLIPSRFPPISLFERVATPEHFDAIYAIQAAVNPRLRQDVGEIALVPAADRVFGHGSSPIMAAFCHLNPEGSRFSDGSWGVYYGASNLATAVAEVSHHRERFLAATAQPAIEVDLRCYVARVKVELHDLRGRGFSKVHAPDDYGPSQQLARTLRDAGSPGLLYRSVRAKGHECVALFKPNAVRLPVTQGPHVTLCWDGQRIGTWYEKSKVAEV